MKILFVCMGNICRSPLAEGLFLHLARARGILERFEVDSAGTGDWHVGHFADPRSQAVASRNGIKLLCRARQVETPDDLETFDLIVAMDRANRRDLRELSPEEHHGKIRLMREWDPEANEELPEVPDPYYGGPQGFENMYAMLRRSCERLLDELGAGDGGIPESIGRSKHE
jgi:protein-tyrosine phosphatase